MTANQTNDQTQQQQEERGPVPYSRFRAVNEKYRAALDELQALRDQQGQQGSEAEDYRAKYDAAQAELSALKRARLQDRAALAHGIPLDIADKLAGDTEEEVMADAKRLAQYMGDRERRPTAPNIDSDTDSDSRGVKLDIDAIKDPAFYRANREAIWAAAKTGRLR